MSALANLKLVAAKPLKNIAPIQLRRNKLIAKLHEQQQLAEATLEGRSYTATRIKRVKNAETGEFTEKSVPKRIKPWYWTAENGKVCLAVRYGNKVLELAKGKTAVEITPKELVSTLDVLKKAVETGELDDQIEAVSANVRKAFKR